MPEPTIILDKTEKPLEFLGRSANIKGAIFKEYTYKGG